MDTATPSFSSKYSNLPAPLHQRLQEISSDGTLDSAVQEICRTNPHVKRLVQASGDLESGQSRPHIDRLTDERLKGHVNSLMGKLKSNVLPLAKNSLQGIPEEGNVGEGDEEVGNSLEDRYNEAKRQAEYCVELEFQAEMERLALMENSANDNVFETRRNWVTLKSLNEDGEEMLEELGDVVYNYESKSQITDFRRKNFRTGNVILRHRINWKLRTFAGLFTIVFCFFLVVLSGNYYYFPDQYAFWAQTSNGSEFIEFVDKGSI